MKCEKCFFDLSKSTSTMTCGVQKHDDISVNAIEEEEEEEGEKKTRRA